MSYDLTCLLNPFKQTNKGIDNMKQGTLRNDVHRSTRSRRRHEHKLRRSSCMPSGTRSMEVYGFSSDSLIWNLFVDLWRYHMGYSGDVIN